MLRCILPFDPSRNSGRSLKQLLLISGILLTVALSIGIFSGVLSDTYIITVSVEGIGSVTPPPGKVSVQKGATISLSAMPASDSNYGFAGWRGDVISDHYQIDVTPSRAMQTTAVFVPVDTAATQYHALAIAHAGTGRGVTIPDSGRYFFREKEERILWAEPRPGYYFAGWQSYPTTDAPNSGALAVAPTSPWHSVTINDDCVVAAWFSTTGYPLHIQTEGAGNVSLSNGIHALASDMEIVLQANPEPGHRLLHWLDEKGAVLYTPGLGDDPTLVFRLERPATCRAIFEPAVRSLVIRTTGTGAGRTIPEGSSSGMIHTFPYHATVPLSAMPEDGSRAFGGWYGEGLEHLSHEERYTPSLTLTLLENQTVEARFVPAEAILTLATETEGPSATSLSHLVDPPPGTYGYVQDETIIVPVTAKWVSEETAAFAYWSGDLPEGVSAYAYSILVPMNASRRITAVFQQENTCRLFVHQEGDGEGNISPPPGTYAMVPGQQVEFRAVSSPHHFFGGWRVEGKDRQDRAFIDPILPLEITEDTTVTARFCTTDRVLEIAAPGEGAYCLPSAGFYRLGRHTPVDIEAYIPEEFEFYHWAALDGRILAEQASARVVLEENLQLHAVYGPPRYALVVERTGTGSGVVITEPNQTSHLTPHSMVVVRAVPYSNSVFAGWTGPLPESSDAHQAEQYILMDRNKQLIAAFEPADFQLTIRCEGVPEGIAPQIIPAPGVYGCRNGDVVELFAAPPPDGPLVFVGWFGDISSINPGEHAPITRNMEIIARFASPEKDDNVCLTVVDNGASLRPLGPGAYLFMRGATLEFSCLPGNDYFGGWTGDYANEINYRNLTVLLDRDKSLGAKISDKGGLLTLFLDHPSYGTITPSPGIYRFAFDREIVLTATRNTPAVSFQGWFDGSGHCLSRHGRYTLHLTENAAHITITGVFREQIPPMEMVLCGRTPNTTGPRKPL